MTRRRAATRYGSIFAAVLLSAAAAPAPAVGSDSAVTELFAEDFTYGTYIIDRPGSYRLMEDISFDPNSPETLTSAVDSGAIGEELARRLELPNPVDAYHAGMPLATQFAPDGMSGFTPGGPTDARYDPAAFGVGFFAAIAIIADDVDLDLSGHTIEQSAEHALLQRFFAVIELADQPFVPEQGPASFGTELEAAHRVTIRNGTIGRSAHHGIHGNANADVTITGVDFDGYEVGAVALNGVDGLTITDVSASNRKDVPVLGTFSSARFIQPYVDHLVRSDSSTTLTVMGEVIDAEAVRSALRTAINDVHHDLVAAPNMVAGRLQIDAAKHPVAYALFHNPSGLLDGNSYSFLVNNLGLAVNGFPSIPDGETKIPSRHIHIEDVEVIDQEAFVNEVIAIDAGGTAAIDPVGAVIQIRNLHPDTALPITISDTDETVARYSGNPVANAQVLVAKAAALGEFEDAHLDVSRSNLPSAVLGWVEGRPGSETLADIGVHYYCDGDSMFHVNKGVIAFKMDAADDVTLKNTSVGHLVNRGPEGSTLCGDYLHDHSHPLANLYGYGGSAVHAYTFAGSTHVRVESSTVQDLGAAQGPVIGFDVMTDSTDIELIGNQVHLARAGWGDPVDPDGPTEPPTAVAFKVSEDAERVTIEGGCATGLSGVAGEWFLLDDRGSSEAASACPAGGYA